MMNVLLIDKGGYFLNFGRRCVEAGHSVRWALGKLKGGDRNPMGDGMGVPKIHDWRTSMRWADLIVIPDNCVYMEELEVWRRRGFPIFGSTFEVSRWELCRGKGTEVLRGIEAPEIPQHTFRRISEAKDFLRANPGRWVSKVNDDNDTKNLSYVSKSAKDMMFMLEHWEKEGDLRGTEFIFQEFIPGTEFAVGGWFGRGGFSRWWTESFEHKKLMDGEVGPNTGEMGTIMRYTQESPLSEALLKPLEGELYRQGYVGYIDIAVMVAKDGTPYPLEFTARFGWPLFDIQQSVHPEPAEWMCDLLEGRDTLKPSTASLAGVCVAIPDFPYCNTPFKCRCGYPLYGADAIPSNHFHPQQVMMGEAPLDDLKRGPTLVTAGDCVCTITGHGHSISAAAKQAYKHLDCLEIPNDPLYRTDIGEKTEKAVETLTRQGWVCDWEY